MHTRKKPCFLNWHWIVLCHNECHFSSPILFWRTTVENIEGLYGRASNRSWSTRCHPGRNHVRSGCRGANPQGVSLQCRPEGWRLREQPLWLHFGEALDGQCGTGERCAVFLQSGNRQQRCRKCSGT